MEYSNQTIEDLMLRFEPQMGEDYQKYKNHLYRVFFNCLMIDEDKDNEEKYAIAAVFHEGSFRRRIP